MNFPVGGSIYDSLKGMKLNIKWQQRKANPLMEKGLNANPVIADMQKQAESTRKANAILNIDGKLKAGEELTDDELEYLRANSPELYKKAMEIKREREEYKRELAKCKTKEDVERLNMQKMQSFISEVSSIRGNANIPKGKKVELLDQILRRAMGILSEHRTFIKSKEYAELPREIEIEDDKNEKKRNKLNAGDEVNNDVAKEFFDNIKKQKNELLGVENSNASLGDSEDIPKASIPKKSVIGTGKPETTLSEKPAVVYNAKGNVTVEMPIADLARANGKISSRA